MMKIRIFGDQVCVNLLMTARETDGVHTKENAVESPNVICHHAIRMSGIVEEVIILVNVHKT